MKFLDLEVEYFEVVGVLFREVIADDWRAVFPFFVQSFLLLCGGYRGNRGNRFFRFPFLFRRRFAKMRGLSRNTKAPLPMARGPQVQSLKVVLTMDAVKSGLTSCNTS